MKTLLKIYFAFMAGVVLAFLALYSIQWRNNKYNNTYGRIALSEEDVSDQHLFFVETKGIHGKEPIAIIEDNDVIVYLYEINYINPAENYENINFLQTYLYPIIISKNDTFGQKGDMILLTFKTSQSDDLSVAPYLVKKYLSLDLFIVETMEGIPLIPLITYAEDEEVTEDKELELVRRGVKGIELYRVTQVEDELRHEHYIDENFTIKESDLSTRIRLKGLIQNKVENSADIIFSEAEKEMLKDEGIFFQKIHNPSEFNYVIYLPLIGYFIVLIISSYFVFFYKRKDHYLGKDKPTEGFIKSQNE